jgi:hypothetical protein
MTAGNTQKFMGFPILRRARRPSGPYELLTPLLQALFAQRGEVGWGSL